MKRKLMNLRDTRYKSLKTWLQAAIKRLADAQEADSWKGGGDPDDMPEIEAELAEAKHELKSVLAAVNDVVDRDIRARFPAWRG